jgi:hypothetical protein
MLMKTKILFVWPIAATLMAGMITPQAAQADVPMIVTYEEGDWSLNVPDADTTASAYGGKLRLYDVHIAKMVEVTHNRCSSSRTSSSPKESGSLIKNYNWMYSSAQGRVDIGHFRISCKLAQSLATAYGLGQPESTTVRFEVSSAVMGSRTEMIPILNITGKKIDQWMNFTRNFKPWTGKES